MSAAPLNNAADWSHVRETINMLYLSMCQIEATLGDSNTSVDTLTKSFVTLAEHTGAVSQQLQSIEKIEDLQQFKMDLANTTQEMQQNIFASVKAFQFYDRVCQRLDHVARGLEKVSAVMSQDDTLHNREAWKDIQASIRNNYTMEAEHIMFEFIMRGGNVKDALNIYRHHFELGDRFPNDAQDDVQLF
jgi:hypothetical protein